MKPVRTLIIDDSSAMRRMLSDLLASDPEIEVAGTAGSAAVALKLLEETNPDVLTLDVEMPDVSGLELLVEIRKRRPKLPVVMFSSLTQRAASTTLDALARGASDYVAKPANTGSREASIEQVRAQLLPKLKALGGRSVIAAPAPRPGPRPRTPIKAVEPIEILAIGSSTGGPNALAELFKGIPRGLEVPVVVVQHMPPLFTKLLAERLSTLGSIPFVEAQDGERAEEGQGYVAPGDHHLRLVRQGNEVRCQLTREAPENSCRPAVDVLFRSVDETYPGRALALVLTGMGQDGLRGCEALARNGAQIVVQDEATSVVWGMPGFVARAGLAQAVLPLEGIAAETMQRLRPTPAGRFPTFPVEHQHVR
ncbi:MAG: chemotaxis response regulator protein-glutamate methylesterase [Deltaproteobacteria bacterium]|nr:chemotaxis response regulator protein-glutamate methylesterase [Deltaproteobacteria bacterium]